MLTLTQPSNAPNFCFEVIQAASKDQPEDSLFIQSDWDYPGTASTFGFIPCECGFTDGTVDCAHKTATEMISAAYDYLVEHVGESVEGSLGDHY